MARGTLRVTIEYEIHSALFWSERLGGYGSEMSRLANRFALAVWPTTAGYAECAKQSAALSSDYGQVLVKLRKAADHVHASRRTNVLPKDLAAEVDGAIDEFQKIRARKESLRPYPVALEKEIRDLRLGMNIAAEPARLVALRAATAAGS